MAENNEFFRTIKANTADLIPYARNSRTHSEEQIAQIAASIREFGFTNPVIIDPENNIIAGHGRVLAAQKLGLKEVPCVVVTGWSEAQKKAYVIADNKLALNAGWDEGMLKLEFDELQDLGFDLELTGFTLGEIGKLTFDAGDGLTDEDAVPETPAAPRSQQGDIWLLGEHRVMCGDSTDQEAVAALMAGGRADMVFTDPPYNVDYGANQNPRHKIRKIKNDAMSEADWDIFVRAYIATIFAFCEGNIYIAMSDKELGHLQRVFCEAGGKWASFIVWVKDRLVLSPKDYHSRHETILYGWKDGVKGRQRVEDRTQDDVWEIARPSNSEEHPTMKPVALVERAIVNSSQTGQVVLDLFGGSGSTLIAAQKTGRQARLMELDPKYVQVILQRWADFTGKDPIIESTGQTFSEVKNAR
jgi:DNA modification methylase